MAINIIIVIVLFLPPPGEGGKNSPFKTFYLLGHLKGVLVYTMSDDSLERADLRASNQMRAIGCELGLIKEADGSARFRQGETCVVASVYGPQVPKFGRQEKYDRGHLDIEYRICGFSGQDAMKIEREGVKFLEDSLTSCVCLEDFPRMMFTLRVVVIRDDGAMLSCALHACALALANAGVEMFSIPASITLFMFATKEEDENEDKDKEGMVMAMDREEEEEIFGFGLDPTLDEEKAAVAKFVFSFDSIVNLIGGGAVAPSVIASRFTGLASPHVMHQALTVAQTGHKAIASFIRKVI